MPDYSVGFADFEFGLKDGKALIMILAIGGPRSRINGISVANVHTKIIGINAEPIGPLK